MTQPTHEVYTVIATFLEPRTAQFNIPAQSEEEAKDILIKTGKHLREFEIIKIVNIKDIEIPDEYEIVEPIDADFKKKMN